MVNAPGIVLASVVTDCLTDFSDLLPTFCELAGVEVPADLDIDGKSIAPVILGKAKDGPREWIMAMGGGTGTLTPEWRVIPAKPYASRTIRDKRFKLIINDKANTTEVYDVISDPGEKRDLAKEQPARIKELSSRLTAWLEETGARMPPPNPKFVPRVRK